VPGVTLPRPVEVITLETIDAEIDPLEAELEAHGRPLPPPRYSGVLGVYPHRRDRWAGG